MTTTIDPLWYVDYDLYDGDTLVSHGVCEHRAATVDAAIAATVSLALASQPFTITHPRVVVTGSDPA